ncbi:MAG: hypothetical protein WBB28_01875 [Crinalium sp.]
MLFGIKNGTTAILNNAIPLNLPFPITAVPTVYGSVEWEDDDNEIEESNTISFVRTDALEFELDIILSFIQGSPTSVLATLEFQIFSLFEKSTDSEWISGFSFSKDGQEKLSFYQRYISEGLINNNDSISFKIEEANGRLLMASAGLDLCFAFKLLNHRKHWLSDRTELHEICAELLGAIKKTDESLQAMKDALYR